MFIVCREMNLCDSDGIESESHGAKLILGLKRLKWVKHLLGGNSPDMPEPDIGILYVSASFVHSPFDTTRAQQHTFLL